MITSSSLIIGHPQPDNRVYVDESHTDSSRFVHRITYLANSTEDFEARLVEHRTLLETLLVENEVAEILETDQPPVLRFSTGANVRQKIRELYRDLSGRELAKLARWIRNRINDGSLTVSQMKSLFGMNQEQWDHLKIRIEAMSDSYDAVESARGE